MGAANGAAAKRKGKEMVMFNGKQLKNGLTIDTHVSSQSGETVYTVCDSIGVIYTTIFPSRIERFYAEAA